MLRGTDISAYQDSIPSGDFCIMKATEGLSYIDPPFASRWKTLAQRGMLRGAYHFSHPSNDPVAEADFFVSVVQRAGLNTGDLLCLDHEVSDGMSPSHCASWAQTWCAHVHQKTGMQPVVYTFLSFAEEGRCASLGSYPLWMADPSSAAGHPRIPAPWSSWVLHQYSEQGGLDHDVFNGDKAAWLALGGGTPTPTPIPQQEDDDMGPIEGKIPAGFAYAADGVKLADATKLDVACVETQNSGASKAPAAYLSVSVAGDPATPVRVRWEFVPEGGGAVASGHADVKASEGRHFCATLPAKTGSVHLGRVDNGVASAKDMPVSWAIYYAPRV